MRFRTRHLALLLLLFSSLSPAEGHALCPENLSAGGRYVSMLLSQRAAAANTESLIAETGSPRIQSLRLPAAALTHHRAAWSMRPASAHSVQVQAASAFAA
jgi:hypothetical protein